MAKLTDIGSLMYLYLDYITPINTEHFPRFVVETTAKKLKEYGDRNWQPLLVKEVGEDQYEILGNEFIYAVAKAAGLDRLWCIIADNKPETLESIKFLTQAEPPKINLCSASKEEIQLALQYVINLPLSPLNGIKSEVAATKIASAPGRDTWETIHELANLKCGITLGSKTEILKQVFFLEPYPQAKAASKPPKRDFTLNRTPAPRDRNPYVKKPLGSKTESLRQEFFQEPDPRAKTDFTPRKIDFTLNRTPAPTDRNPYVKKPLGSKTESLRQEFFQEPDPRAKTDFTPRKIDFTLNRTPAPTDRNPYVKKPLGSKTESLRQEFFQEPDPRAKTDFTPRKIDFTLNRTPAPRDGDPYVEKPINFKGKTLAELKAIAKQRGLKGYTGLNKAELLKKLKQKTLEDFLED